MTNQNVRSRMSEPEIPNKIDFFIVFYVLGLFWLMFWAVLDRLGSPWSILGRLKAVLRRLGPSWCRLGAIMEPSWAALGRLEPSWCRLGAILEPSWSHLGPS